MKHSFSRPFRWLFAAIAVGAFFAVLHLTHSLSLTPPDARAIGPASFVTGHDTIPNFAQNHTIQSVASGNWSSPSTWNLGRVPNSSDIVAISHTVTYDSTTGDPDVIGIDANAVLVSSTTQNTTLRVGTLLVMPNGALEVGTQSSPIPSNFTATIILKNKAINTSTDPDQYGTGILSVDGRVTMHGSVKTVLSQFLFEVI